MTEDITKKDKQDWENFVNSKEKIPSKDTQAQNTKIFKTKKIDLHGLTLNEANKVIENFINKAYLEKISRLIVVTGKGLHSDNVQDPYVSKDLGILKHSVPEFIKNNQNLMSLINEIKDAEIQDGGSGAFYIFLKKNKN